MATLKELKTVIRADNKTSRAFKEVQASTRRMAKGIRNIGKAVTLGVTAPIVAGTGIATKSFIDFDGQLNAVRAAMPKATDFEFDALKKAMIDIGGKSAFANTQIAAASETLAKAGFDAGTQVDGLLSGVIKMSEAAGEAPNNIARALGPAVNNFKLSGEAITKFNDRMAVGANQADTTIAELVATTAKIGAVAAPMGVQADNVAAAALAMRQAGFSMDEAKTSLSNALGKLDAGAFDDILKKYDLTVEKFKNGEGELDMVALFKGIGDAGVSEADLLKMFGVEHLPKIKALFSEAATNNLDVMTNESAGAIEKMIDARMQGLSGAMTRMRAAFDSAQLKFVESSGIGSALEGSVNAVTDLIGKYNEADGAATTLINGMVAGFASGGPVINALGNTGRQIENVKKLAIDLKNTFAAVAGGMKLVGGMALGSAVLAASAIALAVIGIAYNWEQVKAGLNDMGGALVRPFTEGARLVKAVIDGDWKTAIDSLLGLLTAPIDFAKSLLKLQLSIVEGVEKAVLGMLPDEAVQKWENFKSGLANFKIPVLDISIGEAWQKLMSFLDTPLADHFKNIKLPDISLPPALEWLKDFVSKPSNLLKLAFPVLVLPDALKWLKDFASKPSNLLKIAFPVLVLPKTLKLLQGWTEGTPFEGVFDPLLTGFREFGSYAKSVWDNTLGPILKLMRQGAEAIAKLFSSNEQKAIRQRVIDAAGGEKKLREEVILKLEAAGQVDRSNWGDGFDGLNKQEHALITEAFERAIFEMVAEQQASRAAFEQRAQENLRILHGARPSGEGQIPHVATPARLPSETTIKNGNVSIEGQVDANISRPITVGSGNMTVDGRVQASLLDPISIDNSGAVDVRLNVHGPATVIGTSKSGSVGTVTTGASNAGNAATAS